MMGDISIDVPQVCSSIQDFLFLSKLFLYFNFISLFPPNSPPGVPGAGAVGGEVPPGGGHQRRGGQEGQEQPRPHLPRPYHPH